MKNPACRYGKKCIAAVVLLLILAAIPVYAAPNTGAVLEGAKPPMAVQPPAVKGTDITVEGQEPPAQTDGQQKISVKSFRIGGEPPLSAEELVDIIKNQAGRDMTLGELNAIAGRLTQHLRQKGYPVAFAYIPPQDILDGVVEIAVVPGKYGQIKITGDGHFDHDRVRAMLHAATPGAVISREALERALLLLNDLSGVSVKGTLTPGEAPGTADLILDTADTAKISGTLFTDNWGNRYTGSTRYGALLTVNNLSYGGDSLSLGGLTTGQGINNLNFSYSSNLGSHGAKFEIRHSHVGYTLGQDFADLGATGRAVVTGYDVTYPFIRGRTFSLYGTVGYDVKHLLDDTNSSHSPKTSGLWNIGLSGNFADTLGGGGMNDFTLTHYQGKLAINDTAEAETDALNTHTAGAFTKTLFTYRRQQYVAQNLNFHFNFVGQLADKNLEPSEKLFLGGGEGVRAFPQGEASGDEGYLLKGELRWRLQGWSDTKNNVFLAGFYDYGSVMTNKRPMDGAGSNRRSLMGVGLGLLWTRDRDFTIRMDYAWKIGQEAATADIDKNGRLWLQGVRYF